MFKAIQPSINFGTKKNLIMVGQIGQLGMLPYGLEMMKLFII